MFTRRHPCHRGRSRTFKIVTASSFFASCSSSSEGARRCCTMTKTRERTVGSTLHGQSLGKFQPLFGSLCDREHCQ